jgi:hypothetical protein
MEQQVMQQNQKLGTQPTPLTRRSTLGSIAPRKKYFGVCGTFFTFRTAGRTAKKNAPANRGVVYSSGEGGGS